MHSPESMRSFSLHKRRASALVVVLAVTVILALIVVSLAVAMRLERQTAHYFVERNRAALMANEGSEAAKMLLSEAFSKVQLSTNAAALVTMPGRVMTRAAGAANWQALELSSGAATNTNAGVFASADINRAIKTGDNERLIDPASTGMNLRWIYVYKDGRRTAGDVPPALDPANPLIGRYAFWVDDESTKVNLNTARRRMPGGHVPAQVDISAATGGQLTASDADAIFSSTKGRPLQSLAEISRIDTKYAATVSTNRFSFTHYNRNSNVNPWGKPKILLTTSTNNLPREIRDNIPAAEWSDYFLDVLKPGADPALTDSVDSAKLTRVLKRLNSYLTRKDWPFMPPAASAGAAGSFEEKFNSYSSATDRRITQLALNIVQYVRCAESSNPLVSAIRGRWSGEDFLLQSTTAADLFVAGGRGPVITEITCWVSAQQDTDGRYSGQFRFELHLPREGGVASIDLEKYRVLIQAAGSTIAGLNGVQIGAGWSITPANELPAGGYAVVTTPVVPLVGSAAPHPPLTAAQIRSFSVRVLLNDPTNKVLVDLAPSGNDSNIPFPLTRPTTDIVPPLDETASYEVDDPRLNKNTYAWRRRSSGHSFGSANSIWMHSPASPDGLPQDRDGSAYSEHSLALPAPAGTAANPVGRVTSVAELGRVPTGIETSATFRQHSAPWRTLRLQPTTAGDQALPDWALLEIFAAPVVPDADKEAIYFSPPNLVAGQVNINTTVAPFDDRSKTNSIGALLGDPAHPAIEYILNRQRATGGRTFSSDGSHYVSVGELAEIRGISDSGEASEETLRNIASQATIAGSTFRVYSIGQALTQSGSNIRVSAARTTESLLELSPRMDDATPSIFRTLSWEPHSL